MQKVILVQSAHLKQKTMIDLKSTWEMHISQTAKKDSGSMLTKMEMDLLKTEKMCCFVIIGTILVAAILSQKMEDPVDLSTLQPQHAILMANGTDNYAFMFIKTRIWVF